MLPDLQRLIRLQDIETRAAAARQRIAEAPGLIAALDARLTAARDLVTRARQALTDSQSGRRALDRDLIAAQQRLSKYKEQLMEVKTNAEYHAMQHQIAAAGAEVDRVEEQILVNMMEADDLTARLRAAETALAADEAAVAAERAAIEGDAAEQQQALERSSEERRGLVPEVSGELQQLFDRVVQARGVAVAPAVDGHCSICHVRLRPQVYNTILRNEAIIQCDHCQRILYFAGTHQRSAAGQAMADAAHAREDEHGRSAS